MNKRRRLIPILSVAGVLALGAAGLVLLTSFKADAAVTEQPQETRPVRTRVLYPQEQHMVLRGEGFLKPARSMAVTSPMAGVVSESLGGLKSGVAAEVGDVLLALKDDRASLAFESARTEAVRSASQFAATAGLSAEERQQWDAYLAALNSADHRRLPAAPETGNRLGILAATMGVVGSRHALESAALDLSDHSITAPFSGTLVGEGIVQGAWVNPGSPLATLEESSRLELALSLPASELSHVSVGDVVTVRGSEWDFVLDGTVDRLSHRVAPGAQTAGVHVVVEAPDLSIPVSGAFVTAEIQGRTLDSAYRIPRSSLLQGRLPLYDEGILKLVEVRVLAFDGSDVLLAPDAVEPGSELVETILQTPLAGMALRREAE